MTEQDVQALKDACCTFIDKAHGLPFTIAGYAENADGSTIELVQRDNCADIDGALRTIGGVYRVAIGGKGSLGARVAAIARASVCAMEGIKEEEAGNE